MVHAQEFLQMIKQIGCNFFTGVPDSTLKEFCSCLLTQYESKDHVIAANEGNAIGLASGYYLATGNAGLVYMQNSGIGNAINPLVSLADPDVYSIPMLLLIGWRGEPGKKDEPQHVKQGKITTSLLEVADIPYLVLEEENYQSQLLEAEIFLKEQSRPFALVVRPGFFTKCNEESTVNPIPSGVLLSREKALSILLSEISREDIVVGTTGKTSREIFELREIKQQDHGSDFLTVGSMGHVSAIAYEMAAWTKRSVFCIDGDGSFLMHTGGLAVIAQNPVDNFKYILNVNGSHESVGNQPTVGFGINVPRILQGFGFSKVYEAATEEEIVAAVQKMRGLEEMCALVLKTKPGSRGDLGRPTMSPEQSKREIMRTLMKSLDS